MGAAQQTPFGDYVRCFSSGTWQERTGDANLLGRNWVATYTSRHDTKQLQSKQVMRKDMTL